jgi:hypothetical protein
MAALHGDYLRRALPLSRQLLNAVFGQDVRRFQKDIPRRGYDAAHPKRKATRDHPKYPREFRFAAHNLGGARERPCVNRRHGLQMRSRKDRFENAPLVGRFPFGTERIAHRHSALTLDGDRRC